MEERHTKNTTKEKDLKLITICRVQLNLSSRIKQADLGFAVRKDFLDTALVNLQALGGCQILGQLQRR